jgi:hypothetical protein
MRRLASALALSLAAAGPAGATAIPTELQGLVSTPRPAGCSEYSFLLWDFYRAELWSDASRLPGDAFALSLTYRTVFTRAQLVDSSVAEMARISGQPEAAFAAARQEMTEVFRDVTPGDRITAWRAGPDRLRVFVNGHETGALTREVDLFLDIWLGHDTRHPEGRKAMLAGRCDG